MAPFWSENQLVRTPNKKKSLERRAHGLKNLCKLGSKAWSNSRIQLASNESTLVPMNSDLGPPSKVGLNTRAKFPEQPCSRSVVHNQLLNMVQC
jgi:hypothetical protein